MIGRPDMSYLSKVEARLDLCRSENEDLGMSQAGEPNMLSFRIKGPNTRQLTRSWVTCLIVEKLSAKNWPEMRSPRRENGHWVR